MTTLILPPKVNLGTTLQIPTGEPLNFNSCKSCGKLVSVFKVINTEDRKGFFDPNEILKEFHICKYYVLNSYTEGRATVYCHQCMHVVEK